jgi:S1-C subfamily serine protease
MDRADKIITGVVAILLASALGMMLNKYVVRPSFAEIAKSKAFHIKVFRDPEHTKFGGAGSAMYLKQNILLSAGHVCENQNPLMMEAVQNNRSINQPIKFIIEERAGVDLCLIFLAGNPKNVSPTNIAAANSNVMGAHVTIPGFSGGYNYSIRQGNVYAEELLPIYGKEGFIFMRLQAMSVFGQPGISGSGVLNDNGEIVGVANAVGPMGLMMVPLEDIRIFLERNGLLQ